jgi:hypothetical protein
VVHSLDEALQVILRGLTLPAGRPPADGVSRL